MRPFNLEEWLKDKSRKVVTRRGNPVRIICTDRKHGEDNLPIVCLEECSNGGEFLLSCKSDGTFDEHYDTQYDLFFVDDEDELTDFESDLFTAFSEAWQQYLQGESVDVAKWTQEHSKDLIESARNEIKNNEWMQSLRSYKDAYDQGKQDALKSLPKWKKAPEDKDFDRHILLFEDEERVVLTTGLYKGEYYIDLDDLKTLPKEN